MIIWCAANPGSKSYLAFPLILKLWRQQISLCEYQRYCKGPVSVLAFLCSGQTLVASILVDAGSQDDHWSYWLTPITSTLPWRGWGPFKQITLHNSYSYIRFVRMMVLVIPPCLPVSHTNTSYCDFFLHHTINTSQSHNKTQHYITLHHITKKIK